jgi:hypothetical protein
LPSKSFGERIVVDFQLYDLMAFISRHSDEIGLLQQKTNLILYLCRGGVSSAYRYPDNVLLHGMKKKLKKEIYSLI